MAELRLPRAAGGCLRLLQGLRDWSLRAADQVVVLGTDMHHFLRQRGIPARTLAIVSNWSVQAEGGAGAEAQVRAEWGIGADEFVVGYSGNLGRAHDWRTLLDAARRLGDVADLRFVCCGGGHGYGQLQEAVRESGLEARFRFLPYQERERLAASLRVPDLHWFTLKERLTPFIYPSKFFGILQAGRPALFIGDPHSEIAHLIRRHGAGAVVREGQAAALARLIRHYATDREAAREAGVAARRLWEQRFQRETEIALWDRLIRRILADGETSP
jgi:glycosyltransferase involved in cell wall biosynthesis